MRLIDILPKFSQYEDFPYAADLECPSCGKSGFYDYNWSTNKHEKPLLIGWTDKVIHIEPKPKKEEDIDWVGIVENAKKECKSKTTAIPYYLLQTVKKYHISDKTEINKLF